MSEISIDTLKTMLANLDDAKKYQSLRDVMETLPAPDLAAVFDQMLGLIRDALLVKTSRTDVSALISPAYTVKTLQGLCDGLAASTLIAWSRIISDSLDHMRTAANRRVEAELCAVRLCPAAAKAVFASHASSEPAARLVLDALYKKPLITADLHLGEGTGAVASLPLWDMALAVYNHCYSFTEGGIAPYTPQC